MTIFQLQGIILMILLVGFILYKLLNDKELLAFFAQKKRHSTFEYLINNRENLKRGILKDGILSRWYLIKTYDGMVSFYHNETPLPFIAIPLNRAEYYDSDVSIFIVKINPENHDAQILEVIDIEQEKRDNIQIYGGGADG